MSRANRGLDGLDDWLNPPDAEETPECHQKTCRKYCEPMKAHDCGCYVCLACSDGIPCKKHSYEEAVGL